MSLEVILFYFLSLPMRSINWGVILTKLGRAVKDCLPKDVSISTKYPPIKILETGQIIVNLPAETVASFSDSPHEVTYTHNLGYLPLMFPLNIAMGTPPDPHPLATDDWIVDDGIQYDPGGSSPVSDTENVDNFAYIEYTMTTLKLRVSRVNFTVSPVNFPAKRAIFNYTFLDLKSSIEVNYININ